VVDVDQLKFPPSLNELASKLAGVAFDADAISVAGIDRLTRALVARWICAAEHNLAELVRGSHWAHPEAAVQYLDLLVGAKYALADAEAVLRAQLVASEDDDADTGDDEADVDAGVDDEDMDDDVDDVPEDALDEGSFDGGVDTESPHGSDASEVSEADDPDSRAGDENGTDVAAAADTQDEALVESEHDDTSGEAYPADTEHLVAA
jgi:hypothetical protein